MTRGTRNACACILSGGLGGFRNYGLNERAVGKLLSTASVQ